MLAGRAPNAGRFCGSCYHPLGPERETCPHCGISATATPPTEAVPSEIIAAHRVRRSREGLVVRSFAWGGLTLGVTLALVPLAFAGVQWWTIILFFGLLLFFYIFSANFANSVGDALGYRWGQSAFRQRWDAFTAGRDSMTAP
ncbi:MAG: hypothetical protein ABIP58_08965 [Dehalococcoidia bacterium]